MATITRLAAFPDELDKGYLGRTMLANRWQSEKEAMRAISNYFGLGQLPRSEMSALELLSMTAGISIEPFACLHSAIPYRRSITSYLSNVPHGSRLRRSLWCNWGMTNLQPDAFFCRECIAEDTRRHGVSFWHRSHQIPGRYWCELHGTSLCVTGQADAFLSPPARVTDQYDAFPLQTTLKWANNANIKAFLSIAEGLAVRERPLDVKAVASVLKQLATGKILTHIPTGVAKQGLLSDLVYESFPHQWLERIVPSISAKQSGQVFRRIDGVFAMSNGSSSAWVYILAATVLYESADDALQALGSTISFESKGPRKSRPAKRCLDTNALVSAYIDCQGRHSLVSERLGLPLQLVKAKLQLAGFPNLITSRSSSKEPRAAADAYYLHGKDFDESARIGGLTTNEMARLLATSACNFKGVLKAMDSTPKPRRCSYMRKSTLSTQQPSN